MLRVAVGAGVPCGGDDFCEGFVGTSRAQRGSEVDALVSEEAGEEASVGGESRAGAVAAEGAGYGRDDADDGPCWGSVVGGDFAGVGGWNGGKVERLENLEDALCADDFVEPPTVRVTDIHVFDEPHVEVWLIESECDCEDFAFVHGLSDNCIDFNGGKSEGCSGVDAL